MVLAETSSGATVDRPVSHVLARWALLTADSLLVVRSVDPEGLRSRAASTPVDVIVDALRDLGGAAETAAIQELLERVIGAWVGSGDAFKDWWRRVQPQLADDPRVDDSHSLERRYRLLGPGEAKRTPYRDRVTDETRGGRRLAFAPLLKGARERARRPKPALSEAEADEIRREVELADLPELDATDRFMAAELGMWIGLRSTDDAIAVIGEDLLGLDLLRIPQKASRSTALAWLASWVRARDEDWTFSGGVPATLASAAAFGAELMEGVWDLASRLGLSRAAVIEAAVSWAYPGSEASRPWKLPNDYEAYQSRLHRYEAYLASGEQDLLIGVERGAIAALMGLAASEKHLSRTGEVVGQLAKLAVGARVRLEPASRLMPAAIAQLPPIRLEALLQVRHAGGGRWAQTYVAAVEEAFEREPTAYKGPLSLLATLVGEDPGTIALRVTRRAVRRDRVATMALVAAEVASDPGVRADCVSLAVTADPDDPRVQGEMATTANAVATALLDGKVDVAGTTVFTRSGWRQFGVRMENRLADAERSVQAAEATAREAQARLAQATAAAGETRSALAASRSSAETQTRDSTARLAANVLKPVAAALSDSIEAPSLEALQDRLAAALERARIEPVMQPGEVQPFDPDVHRWVGDGEPTDQVAAVSPGFLARLEGEDAVVLVPARVVAAPIS